MKKKIAAYILILSALLSVLTVQANATEIHFMDTIASSNGRVYAVDRDGSLYYWGKGTFNDLVGDQSPERSKPVKLMDGVIGVYANWWSGFAIKSDNSLWAVGHSADSKGGSKEDTDPPVKIMDGVKGIASCYSTWAVLKTDGTVWTWGYGTKKPWRLLSDVNQISAGIESFYAIKNDNTLWGWGDNYNGELGVKTGKVFVAPPIKIMDNVASVCGSGSAAYAVKKDGTLWAWGEIHNETVYNENKETWAFDRYSDGSQSVVEAMFKPVKLMDDVTKVTGRNNMAVIKEDNSLWVWGNNDAGQLGDGTTVSRDIPLKLFDDVMDVTANNANTIVLMKDGTLWGCGTNGCGELGMGCFDYDPHPKLVKIIGNIALPNTVRHIPSPWAADEVNEAIQLDMVPDDLQTLYEEDITRKEFAILLSNLLSKVTMKDLSTPIDIKFTDTNDERILNLAKLGVINGVGNNKFDPQGCITREQAAKMLMEASRVGGITSDKNEGSYADENTISEWAKEGVYFCSEQGIMNGTGKNNFDPKKTYSREMGIITILRLYKLVEEKQEVTTNVVAFFCKKFVGRNEPGRAKV